MYYSQEKDDVVLEPCAYNARGLRGKTLIGQETHLTRQSAAVMLCFTWYIG